MTTLDLTFGRAAARCVDVVHRAKSEVWAVVNNSGVLDELRYDVDACRLDLHAVQVGRPVARAASEVEHWSRDLVKVPSDEGGVDLVSVPVTVEQVDVLRASP